MWVFLYLLISMYVWSLKNRKKKLPITNTIIRTQWRRWRWRRIFWIKCAYILHNIGIFNKYTKPRYKFYKIICTFCCSRHELHCYTADYDPSQNGIGTRYICDKNQLLLLYCIQKPWLYIWYIKNQQAIVLDRKTNLHNIFVWKRGRMSSLKGLRYGRYGVVCVCSFDAVV